MNVTGATNVTSGAKGFAENKGAQPCLVFVHGFLDEGSVWRPLLDELQSRIRLKAYTPDLPGMGSRAEDATPRDLHELARSVLEVVDRIGGAIVIVGHSMGTQIAELVAVARPAVVRGMILLSPIPLGGLSLPPEVAEAMRNLGGNEAGQRALRAQFSPSLEDESLDRLVRIGLKVKTPVVVSAFNAWSTGVPEGNQRSRIDAPVLIMTGEEDSVSSPELMAATIAPRFPGARLVGIANAGHWPHMERPADIALQIERFLAEI